MHENMQNIERGRMEVKQKEVYIAPIIEIVELVLEDSIANSGASLWEDIWSE